MSRIPLVLAALVLLPASALAGGKTLTVPFDSSRSAIGLDVTVRGAPLHMILDTGVDPSVIDAKRVEALHLPAQRDAGGEASGEGEAASVPVYPATIEKLAIAGQGFGNVDALAVNMDALSAGYGRRLDGVLGHSFLMSRVTLIDYVSKTASFFPATTDAAPMIKGCATRFVMPLHSYGDDSIPIIDKFRIGPAEVPASLDTGSNGGVSIYTGALALPGLKDAMTAQGESRATGARGNGKIQLYILNAPTGFGPFTLPAGQTVSVHPVEGSADTRLANIGNKLFAALKLKMLLDYPGKHITFFGGCP